MWCKHAKKEEKGKKWGRFTILPFHHLLGGCLVGCCDFSQEVALLPWIPYWGHQRVCVEGSKYPGDIVYRIFPSSIGKMSWIPESFQLHPVTQAPRLSLSGPKNVWTHLWTDLDELRLQWNVVHLKSCCLWGIFDTKFVDKYCHGFWIWLVQSLGPDEDPICCMNLEDFGMSTVGN